MHHSEDDTFRVSAVTLGTTIAKWRTSAMMTQQRLSNSSGISQGMISYIERDLRPGVSLATVAALAHALHCTVDDLVQCRMPPP